MKPSNDFKKTISDHLEAVAVKDPLFAETLKKENKNIDDCITYIFNQVKASGCNGFVDSEIFNMAVHYFDEDDIKPGKAINAKVIVNRSVELTEDDLKVAKNKAMDKAIAEQHASIVKKTSKAKKEVQSEVQSSLFD